MNKWAKTWSHITGFSTPKLLHFPLHQATKNSPPYPQTRSVFIVLYIIGDTTISLGEPNSWESALTLPGPSPLPTSLSSSTPVNFTFWNITEIHPLLFISTTMILVQGVIVFPWTPRLGSCLVQPNSLRYPSDLPPRRSHCGLSQRQMSSLVEKSLIQSGHSLPLQTHWITLFPTSSQFKHLFLGEAFSDFPPN